MPAAWSAKDERQYKHILRACARRGRYGHARCQHIAGGVVNKRRRHEGRTLSGYRVFYRPKHPCSLLKEQLLNIYRITHYREAPPGYFADAQRLRQRYRECLKDHPLRRRLRPRQAKKMFV